MKTPAAPMPPTEKPARGAKTQALNKLATLKTALAPKKPATPKQLAALQKATAIKKQKTEERRIHRQKAQKKRDVQTKFRRREKEFKNIMDELKYDDSKYDRFKVEREVLEATCEYMEAQYPFLSHVTDEDELIQQKRCELARAKMEEFRAHKERLRRKRRKGISFR